MEGDAGASRLNPTDADETPDESLAVSVQDQTEEPAELAEESPAAVEQAADDRRPSRLGIGWAAVICALLVLLAAGAGVGGYFALRFHHGSQHIARDDAAALQAAKECVSATQAPDTAAMIASESKIIECATGDFGVQAPLYSGVIAEAYQAANVKVTVSDMRAAVERHYDDGSVDVLVAVRVKVTNSAAADQDVGYRLRVKMAADGGKYKIARLDQVTS